MARGIVVVEIDIFSLSCDLDRLHDQEILWLYPTKLFIIWNHRAKFGIHSHYGSRDVT